MDGFSVPSGSRLEPAKGVYLIIGQVKKNAGNCLDPGTLFIIIHEGKLCIENPLLSFCRISFTLMGIPRLLFGCEIMRAS